MGAGLSVVPERIAYTVLVPRADLWLFCEGLEREFPTLGISIPTLLAEEVGQDRRKVMFTAKAGDRDRLLSFIKEFCQSRGLPHEDSLTGQSL